MATTITIEDDKCICCGRCVDVCPSLVFAYDKSNGRDPGIAVKHLERCIRCGHCVAICPEDAVIHEQLPSDMFLPLDPVSISPEALRNLLLTRRSIRAYRPDPVPRSILKQLLEVAVHAGTASNSQNVEFVVIQERQLLGELEALVIGTVWKNLKILGSPLLRRLAGLRYSEQQIKSFYLYYRAFKDALETGETRGWMLRGAPAAILLHAPEKSTLSAANCALAIANMTMLAQTLGLGVCWIGFLVEAAQRSSRFNSILEIPYSRKILGCLVVGYPKYTYTKSVPRNPPHVKWL